MHVVVLGDDREIPRTGVDIADFAAECEPSKCAHIDASAKLEGAPIGVALTRIGAAVGALLRFGIPSVAATGGPEGKNGPVRMKSQAYARRQVQRGVLVPTRKSISPNSGKVTGF